MASADVGGARGAAVGGASAGPGAAFFDDAKPWPLVSLAGGHGASAQFVTLELSRSTIRVVG